MVEQQIACVKQNAVKKGPLLVLTERQHDELIIRDTFLQSEVDLRQCNVVNLKQLASDQPAIVEYFNTKSGKPHKKTVVKQTSIKKR